MTALTRIQQATDLYMPTVESQLEDRALCMDEYSRTCCLMAITGIDEVIRAKKTEWNRVTKNSVHRALLDIGMLQLNAGALPAEVYFILDPAGEQFSLRWGIMGDGHDSVMRRHGQNVEMLYDPWCIREGDDYTPPTYRGLDVDPPTWTPSGLGKYVRVVYPVKRKDGTVLYLSAVREDVRFNLYAHIANGMKFDKNKTAIVSAAKMIGESEGLDAIFQDENIVKHIGPAWREPHSREGMILRKMRMNAIRKYPKDFHSAFTASRYAEMSIEDEKVEEEPNTVELVMEADENVPAGAAPDVSFVQDFQPGFQEANEPCPY